MDDLIRSTDLKKAVEKCYSCEGDGWFPPSPFRDEYTELTECLHCFAIRQILEQKNKRVST